MYVVSNTFYYIMHIVRNTFYYIMHIVRNTFYYIMHIMHQKKTAKNEFQLLHNIS